MKRHAFADLFKRYAKIFRHAWAQRRETDSPALQSHEAQFKLGLKEGKAVSEDGADRIVLICVGVSAGFVAIISAAAAATCGVAMLVPEE